MDCKEQLKVKWDRKHAINYILSHPTAGHSIFVQNGQNGNPYGEILRRCYDAILQNLDPDPMIDRMYTTGYIDSVEKNDLQEIELPSKKIKNIIRVVTKKGPEGFEKFIDMLKHTRNNYLAETLEKSCVRYLDPSCWPLILKTPGYVRDEVKN